MKKLIILTILFLTLQSFGQTDKFTLQWNPKSEWTNEGSNLCGFAFGYGAGWGTGYILHDCLNVKYGYEIGGIGAPLILGSLREFTQKGGGYENRFHWNIVGGCLSVITNRLIQEKYGLSDSQIFDKKLANKNKRALKRIERNEKKNTIKNR